MNRFKVTRESISQTMNRVKSSMSNKFRTPTKNDGKGLEEEVARLLRLEGFRKVETNNRVKDTHGNWSEVDVIGSERDLFHRFFTHSRQIPYGTRQVYVECKQYGPDLRVSLGDVSKFKEVLQLNKHPITEGLFVTTSAYVPRATTIGIRTVDGKQLQSWMRRHKQANPTIKKAIHIFNLGTALIILFLYSQLIFDIREARTKTTDKLPNFQDLDGYKANMKKNGGFNGLSLTSGQSPEQRFSTFVNTFDFLSYWSQYAFYKLFKMDTTKLKHPIREDENKIQSTLKNPGQQQGYRVFVQPKPDSMYMAYELHCPIPTQQLPREEALKFIENEGEKYTNSNPVFQHIPKILKDFYSRWALQRDYVCFNVNLKQYPAKFIPNSITSQYFQVVETTGQTYFKIPVHHSLSCPGYFTDFLTLKLTQMNNIIQKFTGNGTGGTPITGPDTEVTLLNDKNFNFNQTSLMQAPTFSLGGLFGSASSTSQSSLNDMKPSSNNPNEIIGTRYSSNGSMAGNIYGDGHKDQILSKHTSDNSFGDNWFNQGLNSVKATVSSVIDTSQFTTPMSNTDLTKISSTFDDSKKHQLGQDSPILFPSDDLTYNSNKNNTKNDDDNESFDPFGTNPYLNRGYSMVHDDGDDDDTNMINTAGWKAM